jgi:uncharacterized membrane protein
MLRKLQDSFWFLPSAIVAASFLLAVAMTTVDQLVPRELLIHWPRLFGAGADGSRAMLGAVAGSMITVAAVTFSITMLALSQTSSQYSPRVLQSFMSDRTTQVVLGIFVGVFVYCIVVLRTITGGEEHRFLPSISVTVAGVLALVAIGFLVLFIHHMANSLQASSVIARIAGETARVVDRMFPESLDPSVIPAQWKAPGDGRASTAVTAPGTGYVNSIDIQRLVRAATRGSAVVDATARVGAFVVEGDVIAQVSGVPAPNGDACRSVADCFVIERRRSIHQDPAFGIQQLVDIALKALSPGINDPTTAVMAIERIAAVLSLLAERRIEPQEHRDRAGDVRVRVAMASFTEFADLCFAAIRAATRDPVILRELASSVRRVAGHTRNPLRRAALTAILRQLTRAAAEITEPDDRAGVEDAIASAHAALSD